MGTLMKLKLLLPAVALAVLNTACSMDTVSSKDVKAESIYQNYSLDYREEGGSTALSAQFRVGGWSGTTVDLEDPAAVKINGRTPGKSSFLGTRYELTAPGFVPSAVFEYTDSDGKTIINKIAIDPMYLLKADQTVSVYAGYQIDLNVVNLGSDESVRVTLEQQDRASDGSTRFLSAEGTYDRGRAKAVFSAQQLMKLNNGTAKLQVIRSKMGRLSQTTREGGVISASYALRPLSVTIVGK